MIVTLIVILTAGGLIAGIGFGLRERSQPGTTTYLALLGALTILTVLTALPRLTLLSESSALEFLLAGWMCTSALWALFAFTYTGRGPAMTPQRSIGLLSIAVVTMVALLTLDMLGLSEELLALILAPLLVIVLSLAVFGVFLIARAGLIDDDLPTSQSVLLTGAGTGVILVFLTSNLGVVLTPAQAGTVTLGMLAATASLFLTAQFGYKLLQTGPSAGYLAREVVLDEMSDCVLLVDRQSRLIDANHAADDTFQLLRSNALGQTLSDVFGTTFETDQDLTTLSTRTGQREFEVTRSSLTNSAGEPVGDSIVLRDVTDRRTHEQRLAVLNRVLRHNLRNDLDAIRSFAEAIEAEPSSPEAVAFGERIEATATELFELGEMVARAERQLTRTALENEAIDIPHFVSELQSQLGGQYPDCTLSVTTPRPLSVRTDKQLLHTALLELVRNACEHTDAGSPAVDIAVTRTPDGVQISVADNGPGIPEQERAVLLAGEETPLRHGSGIGLWVVYWAVTRIGGTLSFSENTPRGSIVTITLSSNAGTAQSTT